MSYPGAAASVPFAIDVAHRVSGTVVSVRGEVDMVTAVHLQDTLTGAIAARPGHPVTIDFAGVSLLDAAGMTALLRVYRDADRHHAAIELMNAQPLVVRALAIVDLLTRLRVS